jgi:hypothetical protein
MDNKLCPMKIEMTNDSYWCIGSACAWWVVTHEKVNEMYKTVGRCAVTQLAIEINCNTKEVNDAER